MSADLLPLFVVVPLLAAGVLVLLGDVMAASFTADPLLVARTGLWAWALHPAAQTLGARDLWRKLPLLEGGYALYNALLAPLSMAAGRLQRW